MFTVLCNCGGWNNGGGWKIFIKSINGKGGFFCGGWNFSKSVSVGPMFIKEMRVDEFQNEITHYGS